MEVKTELNPVRTGQTIRLQLIILEQGKSLRVVPLDKPRMTMGREGGCDILLSSLAASRVHGTFITASGATYYMDSNSKNGTERNGVRIGGNGNPCALLCDGDVLRINGDGPNQPHWNGVTIVCSERSGGEDDWKTYPLATIQNRLLIGRNAGPGHICIPKVTVSRVHASVTRTSYGWVLADHGSLNGTIVNGTKLRKPRVLAEMDVICIATTKLIYAGGQLLYNQPRSGIGLQTIHLSRTVQKKGVFSKRGKGVAILQDINLTIHAGELVAIVGGSGAGKSTLMNCMNGFEPGDGRVLVNGDDLYRNYRQHKADIGYVPQQDIVHDDLTVKSMLSYVARLRLPKDLTKREISRRVEEVLAMVGLQGQRNTFIKKLSGGQRKRASIAVELISDPALFFLDEPTSGLDPEAETSLMKQLCFLARQKGKTVIVVTHTLQNIHLFDKIIFLAPGGRLCFFGGHEEALRFFQVKNLVDAYELVSRYKDYYVYQYAVQSQRQVQ